MRRALDLWAAARMGVQVWLDAVAADEFYAMLLIEEERDRFERENMAERR